ncbi:PREDICTED: Fanconi anemia core complex-associated protein 100 [Nanorana parkeri]|uniref:Fanconi anemia core complex-associated protein 100 n=1 Tax=Nanorana parkeri TaxID=125878 RepID=UPI000854977D|nr:PREDICTED: Fanconi anemia core complex-associated protein 100 [Nanorana parkeri]
MVGIEQLAQFRRPPAIGPPGSKGGIAWWRGDLYVCSGHDYLHVFCVEKKLMTHAEFYIPRKKTVVTGEIKLLKDADSTTQQGSVTVHHIGPSFCRLRDPSAASFIVSGDVLVLAVQQTYEWKFRIFLRKSLRSDAPAPSREVTLAGKAAVPNTPPQPVMCCVSLWKENKVPGASCDFLQMFSSSQLLKDADSTTQQGSVTVHHIGPSFCRLRDPSAASFIVSGDVLVLAVQQTYEWKFRIFLRKSLRSDAPAPSREVTLAGKAAVPNTPPQPVMCCVSLWKENKVPGASCDFLLEARLFTRLFGVDLAMLDSPIILCGFPDGRVAYFPLRSSASSVEHQSSCKLLYHLEQPVASVGATKTGPGDGATEQPMGGSGTVPCDCVLLIGQKGSLVSVTSGGDGGGAACEYRKYPVQAPVCCAFYSTAGVIYSNHSNLFSITVPSAGDGAAGSAPRCSVVSSVRHNVPMIAAVSGNECYFFVGTVQYPHMASFVDRSQLTIQRVFWSKLECPEENHTSKRRACKLHADSVLARHSTALVLLSSRGRLMLLRLNQKGSGGRRPGLGSDNTGHRIKELLSGIGSASDRVSRLKSAVDEKSRSLQKLNQVMSLSRQLLSGRWASGPVLCHVTASWTKMLQTDRMTVSCVLENRTDCILEGGWTLCVLISSDVSYSFPLTSLKPGERTEVTFPLPAHAYRSLDFPIKISFTLFYNLKGLVADSGLPAGTSPDRHGVCIPLQEHSVDLLQCLRFGPRTSHPGLLPVMAEDLVQVFVMASSAGKASADHPDARSSAITNQGIHGAAPLKARVRISASLLAQALQNGKSGTPLCSAVLHWLVSTDVVKEQSLVEVQGVTPDGKDFSLQVQEITVSDLTASGSVPVIEIQILGSHLHVVASLHLAVISRFQILLQRNKDGGHTPNVDLGKVQRQFSAQEPFLKELKTLKERLQVDEDIISSTAAERLLHIYRELRDPGLFFI